MEDKENPSIKNQWYETDSEVVISLFIKNCKEDDILKEITEDSVCVIFKETSAEFKVKLRHKIRSDQIIVKFLSTKIEIKLKKVDALKWSKLEEEVSLKESLKENPDIIEHVHKYPSSSHVARKSDYWDKLTNEVKKEEENEELDGDNALNKVFQKIYGDGSDDVKKAMMKSFQESGGTVLSTNWNEIGKKKTEIKPPDGMEWKKYDN